MSCKFHKITGWASFSGWLTLLLVALGAGPFVYAEDLHEDDVPTVKEKPPAKGRRPKTREDRPSGCQVSSDSLADFANGQGYDFGSLVNFVTASECLEGGKGIAAAAISSGVTFKSTGPIKLDDFAKSLSGANPDEMRRLDLTLSKSVPEALRQNPLSSKELLPLTGQLALLSPTAARASLINLIQQELYVAEPMIGNAAEAKGPKNTALNTLAKNLVRMGATEELIAAEMSQTIEEMAVLAQADSLAKMLKGLALATNVQPELAPTFNLSAEAFSRGVLKSQKILGPLDKAALLKAAFAGVRSAMGALDALETGTVELNEALQMLTAGMPLQKTSIKSLWKEVVKVLIQTPTQSALAYALSLSLTPDIVFLSREDMHLTLLGARNYPELATAVQTNFLQAFETMWLEMSRGSLKPQKFNEAKARFLEPMVSEMLEWPPSLIDHRWLREVWRRDLISDADTEKRFPRFVLAYYEKNDAAEKQAAKNNNFESGVGQAAGNFALVWTLSSVHIPALMKWVKKYDE